MGDRDRDIAERISTYVMALEHSSSSVKTSFPPIYLVLIRLLARVRILNMHIGARESMSLAM